MDKIEEELEEQIKLSPCLQSVETELKPKEESVTSIDVVREICQQHDPSSRDPLYSDIINAISSLSASDNQSIDIWLKQMRGLCGSAVQTLHTNLSLLLVAKLSPTVWQLFFTEEDEPDQTPSKSSSNQSIGKRLLVELYEYFGDVLIDHQITTEAEFKELVINDRKTDGRTETVGRDKAAILYSSNQNLEFPEKWTDQIIERRGCFPIRFSITVDEFENKLLQKFSEAIKTKAKSYESDSSKKAMLFKSTVEIFSEFSDSRLSASEQIVAELQKINDGNYGGIRLVLLMEFKDLDLKSMAKVRGIVDNHLSTLGDRIIIVIGGVPYESSIETADGVWAYHLEISEAEKHRSQPIVNDQPNGDDLLDVTQEAYAIADIMASVEVSPPLAVGICGGWGAGKSFVLDLIDRRLKEIRAEKVDQTGDALHVGHIYCIEFDAWTYSKDNLWASLMDQICCQLEQQLNIERIQKEDFDRIQKGDEDSKQPPRIALEYAPWAVSNILAGHEMEKWAQARGWRVALNQNKKSLGEMLVHFEQPEKTNQAHRLMEETDKAKKKKQKFDERLAQYLDEHRAKEAVRSYTSALPMHLAKALGVSSETITEAQQIRSRLSESRALIDDTRKIMESDPSFTRLVVVVAAAFGIVMYAIVENGFAAFATTVVPAAALFINQINQLQGQINSKLKEFNSDLVAHRGLAEVELKKKFSKENPKFDELSETIQNNEAELNKMAQEQDNSLQNLRSLEGFLKEIRDNKDYSEKLGIMSLVQSHLNMLSQLMVGWQNRLEPESGQIAEPEPEPESNSENYQPFFRGTPRIILKIDDIDRCPPETVVQVLEAAQLLVKTDLFVVVLALDLRYVTRAIEDCYKGVLEHNRHPTGLDYIEKIIQIPYKVRPIAKSQVSEFFRGNLDYVPDPVAEDTGDKGDSNGGSDSKNIEKRMLKFPAAVKTKQLLQLNQTEFDDLVAACGKLDLSPRSGKRISNVYKIWKLLWHERRTEPETESINKRIMVAFLALSTVRPRLARQGLSELSRLSRQTNTDDTNLNDLFLQLARELKQPTYVERLFSNDEFFPAKAKTTTLTDSELAMLTSFTFVGGDRDDLIQDELEDNDIESADHLED